MQFTGTLKTLLGALALSSASVSHAVSFSAASGVVDYAQIVELGCNYDYRSGWEFQFPSADPVLQPYGFILWKNKASIVANPLDYDLHRGLRGKLTGETVLRDGIRWFAGLLEDCTRIYAEDASAHSEHPGLEHLIFHGKVFFEDTYAAAQSLIGHDVLVRGEGLEPRQRLYTARRGHYFPLRDGEALRVVGIDTHRYAHTKGVGPFFLQVENVDGNLGLIKYNPQYLAVPHGVLPVYVQTPGRMLARNVLPARSLHQQSALTGNQPVQEQQDAYMLLLNRYLEEEAGMNAVLELQQAGFEAELMPVERDRSIVYELRVEGFATADMAETMAQILANRFGWIELPEVGPAAVAHSRHSAP